MLAQSHFIAFNEIKSKYLSNPLRALSVYINQLHTSTSRSRTEQDPHLSLQVRKFCRPTSGNGVLEQGFQTTAREAVSPAQGCNEVTGRQGQEANLALPPCPPRYAPAPATKVLCG